MIHRELHHKRKFCKLKDDISKIDSTYKVLRNLMAPKKPGEYVYKDILEHLRCYYSPKPLIIVQQCKLNTRYRQQGESVAKFMAELRQIAQFVAMAKPSKICFVIAWCVG